MLAQQGIWGHWVWPVFLFVFGLGLMVFVHELGHFLVAKWVGIKVERFAIGMGPRLFGFKPGETDYCVCMVPLGGYVKMLGQEDFKPLEEGDQPDPRSYQSKSVGKRFAVISAGVIMNIILAAALFVTVGLVGKDFVAPVIGFVEPGGPASQAKVTLQDPPEGVAATSKGLKPGDRVLSIAGDSIVLTVCGEEVEHWIDIVLAGALADPDDEYVFTFERTIGTQTVLGTATMKPRATRDGVRFGIVALDDLTIGEANVRTASPFEPKDEVTAVNGRPVQSYAEIYDIEESLDGGPVTVTIKRDEGSADIRAQPVLARAREATFLKDGTVVRGEVIKVEETEVDAGPASGEEREEKTIQLTIRTESGAERTVVRKELEPNPFRMLGMIPRMRVVGVAASGAAVDAGVKPGDVIVSYAGTDHPDLDEIRHPGSGLNAEGEAQLTVLRDDANGTSTTFTVKPKKVDDPSDERDRYILGVHNRPDYERLVVAKVRKGSPADKIPAGATLTAVNDTRIESWFGLYHALCDEAGKTVKIAYTHGETEGVAEIALTREAFRAEDYRWVVFDGDVVFVPLQVKIQQDGVLASLAWGGKVTVKQVLSVYLSIRSLIRGWAPANQMAGPLGIGTIAVKVGRESFMDFVYFLGIISAAIAVFNFLPFPVVDGGHAVFLLIEKIRGKPLSVRITNVVQVSGLVLLGCLFILVTWQDIMRLL